MNEAPKSIKSDGAALVIEWPDGAVHRLSWPRLRDVCPCAVCRVERAKRPQAKPLLPVLSTAEARPIVAVSMKPVGNYAYAIAFSDGHSSGIYSLEYLRQLGEQQARSLPADD